MEDIRLMDTSTSKTIYSLIIWTRKKVGREMICFFAIGTEDMGMVAIILVMAATDMVEALP
jgi:hypothetical protein